VAKRQREGFDEQGQPLDAPKGEPDQIALKEIAKARELPPEVPEDEPRETVAAPTVPDNDLVATLRQAFSNPEVRTALRDAVTEDPELRALFKIPAGTGRPSGHYRRNYRAERQLHVTGGLEVEHDPSFRPLAPDTIKMYLSNSGNGRKTSDPNEAQRDSNGEPLLTDEYKWFLDVKMQGKRPTQRELVDIDVGAFVPGDPGVM